MSGAMSAAGVALLESCPPTIVKHCAAACMTGAGAELVVARATALELYTLHEEQAPTAAAVGKLPKSAQMLDSIAAAQLRFVTRMPLNGAIASMRVVPSPGLPHDRLLLAFADAKVALIDFDAEVHALRTVAAYSFRMACWGG